MSAFLRSASRTAVSSARSFSTSSPREVARITVIGRLADTPELRTSASGRQWLRYTVNTRSGPASNPKTSWWNVNAWIEEGPQRQFLQNLPKGSLVMVDGDVTIDQWVTAEGTQRSALNIRHRSIEVLRRPRRNIQEGEQQESQQEGQQQ